MMLHSLSVFLNIVIQQLDEENNNNFKEKFKKIGKAVQHKVLKLMSGH